MEWIHNLRVIDLKEELKKRDLPVSGKKAELVARLEEAVQAEEQEKPTDPGEPAADAAQQEPAAHPTEEQPKNEGKPSAKGEALAQEDGNVELSEASAGEEDNQTVLAEANDGQPVREEELQPALALDKEEAEVVNKAPGNSELSEQPKQGQRPAVPQQGADATAPELATESAPAISSEPAVDPAAVPVEQAAEGDHPAKAGAVAPLHPPVSQERHNPDPIPAVEEPPTGLPAIHVALAAVEEPVSATPAREERLPAMQAALLAPQATAAEVPPDAEMEEAVDFEADEVDEPVDATPAEPDIKEGSTKAARQASQPADEPASKRQRSDRTDLSVSDSAAKRKREPIPSFKSRERSLGAAAEELSKKPSLDKKPSVFQRIGQVGEEVPAGTGAPPTRTKPTRALLVTGFIRPFTVIAAQNLFKSYGEVEQMWMPSIRDKAYVIYKTEESAEAARQATHGLEWPHGNRTSLRPKFVPVEEAEAVISSNGKELPTKASGLAQTNSGFAAAAEATAKAAAAPLEKKQSDRVNGAISQSRNTKPELKVKEEKDEEKVVTLEDLFRRTQTVPHLYWKPLSQDEALARHNGLDKVVSKPDGKREKA